MLIDPSGAIRWEYTKTQLVPYVEAPYFERGDGVIPATTTAFGTLGGAICYDLDAPGCLQQAGATGIGLLLALANDYPASARLHQRMAAFRAVEQGFSLWRAADNGISAAINPLGQVLDELDHRGGEVQLLLSELPIARITTLYAQIGDAFLWACLACLAPLVLWSLVSNWKSRKGRPTRKMRARQVAR